MSSLCFVLSLSRFLLFFLPAPAPTEIYTLSLHDALPMSRRGVARHAQPRQHPGDRRRRGRDLQGDARRRPGRDGRRSEEHTSELQSPCNLVCRLLLEKKKCQKHGAKRLRAPPANVNYGRI